MVDRLGAEGIGIGDREAEKLAGADEPGNLPPSIGQRLEQLGGAGDDVEEQAAGSPSSMKPCPAATSVTTAIAESRARSASGMALHTLRARTSQLAHRAVLPGAPIGGSTVAAMAGSCWVACMTLSIAGCCRIPDGRSCIDCQ